MVATTSPTTTFAFVAIAVAGACSFTRRGLGPPLRDQCGFTSWSEPRARRVRECTASAILRETALVAHG